MLRRLASIFCLPCRRETVEEPYRLIAVADDDLAPYDAKEANAVYLRYWMPTEPQPPLVSFGARDASLEERPSVRSLLHEDRIVGTVNDATILQTVALVHAGQESGDVETPAPSRCRRGCRHCWADRVAQKKVVLPHGRRGYRLSTR